MNATLPIETVSIDPPSSPTGPTPSVDSSRSRDPEKLATGCRAFDRLLAGGLRAGEIVEVYGSCGRFSLALKTLAAGTRRLDAAALIDLGNGFDPENAAAGVQLEHLLWVRPRDIEEALASAEAAVESGVPLVVLDVGLVPIAGGRGAETSWHRLSRATRAQGVTVLISSPYRLSGAAARSAVEAFEPQPRWRRQECPARILAGTAFQLELRSGHDARRDAARDVEVLKLRARRRNASLPPERAIA